MTSPAALRTTHSGSIWQGIIAKQPLHPFRVLAGSWAWQKSEHIEAKLDVRFAVTELASPAQMRLERYLRYIHPWLYFRRCSSQSEDGTMAKQPSPSERVARAPCLRPEPCQHNPSSCQASFTTHLIILSI